MVCWLKLYQNIRGIINARVIPPEWRLELMKTSSHTLQTNSNTLGNIALRLSHLGQNPSSFSSYREDKAPAPLIILL